MLRIKRARAVATSDGSSAIEPSGSLNRCGNDARTRSNIIVTVPRCDGEPKIQERNVKAGQDYFRVLADHARQSFRLNKAGYAAYARYAIDQPFYSECATP